MLYLKNPRLLYKWNDLIDASLQFFPSGWWFHSTFYSLDAIVRVSYFNISMVSIAHIDAIILIPVIDIDFVLQINEEVFDLTSINVIHIFP